uniref:17beta-estradiol 17-dehydrogenase n=1 Tax=Vombatus ursinus TaxID=29139 RepID=A0A4X2JS12_VOMUR
MVSWMELGGSAFEMLGTVAAAWWLLRVAWWLGHALLVYGLPQVGLGLGISLRKQGAWAVVTGATSGIGRSYAHELARRGLNVVLVSRDLDKLRREAEDIERLHGKETRVIQVDFTGSLEVYEIVERALEGLEIGILVNNVGVAPKIIPQKLMDLKNAGKVEKATSPTPTPAHALFHFSDFFHPLFSPPSFCPLYLPLPSSPHLPSYLTTPTSPTFLTRQKVLCQFKSGQKCELPLLLWP